MSSIIQRLSHDEWSNVIPIVAFFLTLTVFLFFSWRAIRMKKSDRAHMAALPLTPETEEPEK